MLFQLFLGTVRLGSVALVVAAFASSLLGVANAQDESLQCSEEVFNVSQEMQQQYGLNVSQPVADVVNDRMNPFPGSLVRNFPMITLYNDPNPYVKKTTFNAENFMNSTGVQLRLAKRVMEACPSTSKVGFGFAKSGYWIEYFRMPSGQVRQGIPLDCGRGNGDDALQWGYFYSC
jgi:hypothetical protein